MTMIVLGWKQHFTTPFLLSPIRTLAAHVRRNTDMTHERASCMHRLTRMCCPGSLTCLSGCRHVVLRAHVCYGGPSSFVWTDDAGVARGGRPNAQRGVVALGSPAGAGLGCGEVAPRPAAECSKPTVRLDARANHAIRTILPRRLRRTPVDTTMPVICRRPPRYASEPRRTCGHAILAAQFRELLHLQAGPRRQRSSRAALTHAPPPTFHGTTAGASTSWSMVPGHSQPCTVEVDNGPRITSLHGSQRFVRDLVCLQALRAPLQQSGIR